MGITLDKLERVSLSSPGTNILTMLLTTHNNIVCNFYYIYTHFCCINPICHVYVWPNKRIEKKILN